MEAVISEKPLVTRAIDWTRPGPWIKERMPLAEAQAVAKRVSREVCGVRAMACGSSDCWGPMTE